MISGRLRQRVMRGSAGAVRAALVLLMLACCARGLAGQRVESVLNSVPAATPAQRDALRAELARLTSADIAELCALLVEPGAGDDTQARLALSAITFCAGDPGAAALRERYTSALGSALGEEAPAEVKRFLVRQLQLAGGAGGVEYLTPLLEDDDLCLTAAQALLAIGGDAVAAAFREPLPRTRGRGHLAVIDALGMLQDRMATDALMAELDSGDGVTRMAALWALASIGAPVGDGSEAAGADGWFDRSQIVATALRRFERQSSSKNANAEPPRFAMQDDHVRCAVLYGLARTRGAQAIDSIVAALTDASPEVRAAAGYLAVDIKGEGVTQAFVDLLNADDENLRVNMLDVLERRGDVTALPVVLKCLMDADTAVCRAAIAAAATLGQADAVGPLIDILPQCEPAEREAVRGALARIESAETSDIIAGRLTDAPMPARVTLLGALTDRRAVNQLEVILAQTTADQEQVRRAAFEAVGILGDESVVPRLIELLPRVESAAERTALEQALSDTSLRAHDPVRAAAPLLTALDPGDADEYCSLLRVLARIGGKEVLAAVAHAARDKRKDVSTAAIRAFNEWPNDEAAGAVLEIATETAAMRDHVLAMRAYARLAALDTERSAASKLALYARGLDVARRDEERKLLIGKLGGVYADETVSLLARYLEEDELRDEAAAALVSVVDGLLPDGWEAARPAVERVEALDISEELSARAAQLTRRADEFEGYITRWLVAGPYQKKGRNGHELHDIPFAPEKPGAGRTEWQVQPRVDGDNHYWLVDLNLPTATSDAAKYLFTQVYSPSACDVRVELGSDDGVKMWINGEVVHAHNVPRGCTPGADKFEARLTAGWNQLMLKVTNGGGGFAAALRLRSSTGGALDGLKVKAEYAASPPQPGDNATP